MEKLQKILKKYNKWPAKGAREARPFVAEAFFCTFSIFFAIFPKNGPGSFPQGARYIYGNVPKMFAFGSVTIVQKFTPGYPCRIFGMGALFLGPIFAILGPIFGIFRKYLRKILTKIGRGRPHAPSRSPRPAGRPAGRPASPYFRYFR